MTLARSIAIACFCIFLIPVVSGQQADDMALFSLDSLATDTTGGVLAVPNVFTPNDDEINDYFEVQTDGSSVYEFSVFTRTGTRVFQSSSPRIFWDGRSNGGQPLKEGVYYYVIEATGDADPFKKAGFIYLYR